MFRREEIKDNTLSAYVSHSDHRKRAASCRKADCDYCFCIGTQIQVDLDAATKRGGSRLTRCGLNTRLCRVGAGSLILMLRIPKKTPWCIGGVCIVKSAEGHEVSRAILGIVGCDYLTHSCRIGRSFSSVIYFDAITSTAGR
jgi:hypothetical protein